MADSLPLGAAFYSYAECRVTRRLGKICPNFGKSSQKSSQIKNAKLSSLKLKVNVQNCRNTQDKPHFQQEIRLGN
jgi:hypothetical protein